MTPVRLKPAAPQSRVKHSTTEPLRSLVDLVVSIFSLFIYKTRPNSVLDLHCQNTDCILTYLLGETMSKFNIQKI